MDVDATRHGTFYTHPLRIAWHHIPKCGTSFGNTLVHWASPRLPENISIGTDERAFMQPQSVKDWFWDDGPIFWMKDGNFGNHHSITDAAFAAYRGKFAGIFRNPALRAQSAHSHFERGNENLTAYATRIRGSSTKMLAGQGYGLECLLLPTRFGHSPKFGCHAAVKPDVEKALSRLLGFAFVGVMELYDLSVCLFHAMYGGRCLPVEFANTRPGALHEAEVPTAAFTAWGGVVDGSDWVIYSAVLQRFFRDLQLYSIGEATCAKLCPTERDRFSQYRGLFRRLR